jgi:hypothetical protein
MKFLGLMVPVAALVAILSFGGGSALAASCPSAQSVLPYSKNDPPYQCAQVAASGKKSIGAWDTKSWTNSTAFGYTVRSHCKWRSNGEVSITEGWEFSSYTATATNFATSKRHWAAGVLFTTGPVDSGGYSNGCEDHDGHIENSIERITSALKLTGGYAEGVAGQPMTITASISPSETRGNIALLVNGTPVAAGPISGGNATLAWTPPAAGTYQLTAAYQGDTSACPSTSSSCGFTPEQSGKYTATVAAPATTTESTGSSAPAATTGSSAATASVRGLAGPAHRAATLLGDARPFADLAATAGNRGLDLRLTTRTRSATLPAPLALRCPAGSVLMNASLLAGPGAGESLLRETRRGAALPARGLRAGSEATLQITCRQAGAPLAMHLLGYGTPRPDRMVSGRRSATLFGGPGGDRLGVRGEGGVAFGGHGGDRIVVDAGYGAGAGGPGDERHVSRTAGRALLVGGSGHDTFVVFSGRTFVNALDGERDTIICRGGAGHVLADPEDTVKGPCQMPRRPHAASAPRRRPV